MYTMEIHFVYLKYGANINKLKNHRFLSGWLKKKKRRKEKLTLLVKKAIRIYLPTAH